MMSQGVLHVVPRAGRRQGLSLYRQARDSMRCRSYNSNNSLGGDADAKTSSKVSNGYANKSNSNNNNNDMLANVVQPGRNIGGRNSSIGSTGRSLEVVRNFVLHCKFTKNNTHFSYCAIMEDPNYLDRSSTLSFNEKFNYYVNLPSKVKFSLSTGCLGFRKAARGEYEAAFQTATKCFQLIEALGDKYPLLRNKPIDIIMKDFGKGRLAFSTALNGKEGTPLRRNIRQISDATPLKFGGVRAPGIRRL